MVIRTLAMRLTSGLLQKDFRGEAKACYEFTRNRIRYVKDIRGVETLQYPEYTLAIGAGDCDDKAILLASLLMSIGHKLRFIAISQYPDTYSHVWAQVLLGREWVDMDPTEDISFAERVPETGVIHNLYREI